MRVRDVTVMDIYDIKMKRRGCDRSMSFLSDIASQSHPVQKFFLN
jgi:hypothetical protein